MNLGKFVFSAGGLCVAGGCGTGGYFIVKNLKDKSHSANNESVGHENPVNSKNINSGELPPNKGENAALQEGSLDNPVVGAPKVQDTVVQITAVSAKSKITSSNSGKGILQPPLKQPQQAQEEVEDFTGQLVVYRQNKNRDEAGHEVEDDFQLILLTKDKLEERKSEWMIIDEKDGGESYFIKNYQDFEITKPINEQKAQDFLDKLNLSFGSSNGKEKSKEKFKNSLKTDENKTKFESIFGSDLYEKTLDSADSIWI